jgi:hypothetical protein
VHYRIHAESVILAIQLHRKIHLIGGQLKCRQSDVGKTGPNMIMRNLTGLIKLAKIEKVMYQIIIPADLSFAINRMVQENKQIHQIDAVCKYYLNRQKKTTNMVGA